LLGRCGVSSRIFCFGAGGCCSEALVVCMDLVAAGVLGGAGGGAINFLRSMLSAILGGIARECTGVLAVASVLTNQKTPDSSAPASAAIAVM
jgi:hypothetical protein